MTETRKRVERGIYLAGPCTCSLLRAPHKRYDIAVGTGRHRATGKYGQKWKRHHGTITTAREERHRLLVDVRSLRTTATLDDLFTAWLTDIARRGAAPNTVRNYRRDTVTYWETLADRPLHKIARSDVKAVLDALLDRGVGTSHAHSAISAAFTWAVQEEWVSAHEDPTKNIRRPSKVSKIPQVPSPDQVKAVLAEARAYALEDVHDERCVRRPEMERFVFLGAVMGVRSSELRGLRVSDIDLGSGVVGLVRAMSAEKEWTLKNRQERPVGLDDLTMAVVAEQVRFMSARASSGGLHLVADAYLFSDSIDGADHWKESMVTKYVSTLFDHAARPEGKACTHRPGQVCPRPGPLAHFTFRHLRKFAATYARELGYGTTDVAARLGHDPAVAHRFYVGANAENDRAMSAGLAGAISPAP